MCSFGLTLSSLIKHIQSRKSQFTKHFITFFYHHNEITSWSKGCFLQERHIVGIGSLGAVEGYLKRVGHVWAVTEVLHKWAARQVENRQRVVEHDRSVAPTVCLHDCRQRVWEGEEKNTSVIIIDIYTDICFPNYTVRLKGIIQRRPLVDLSHLMHEDLKAL